MPLTASSLKGKLETEIGNVLDIADSDQLADVCEAIANAVIDEITSNAVVPSTGLVAPVGGGPVTGATTVT